MLWTVVTACGHIIAVCMHPTSIECGFLGPPRAADFGVRRLQVESTVTSGSSLRLPEQTARSRSFGPRAKLPVPRAQAPGAPGPPRPSARGPCAGRAGMAGPCPRRRPLGRPRGQKRPGGLNASLSAACALHHRVARCALRGMPMLLRAPITPLYLVLPSPSGDGSTCDTHVQV